MPLKTLGCDPTNDLRPRDIFARRNSFFTFRTQSSNLGIFLQVVIVQDLDKPRCAGAFWGEVTVRVKISHTKDTRAKEQENGHFGFW